MNEQNNNYKFLVSNKGVYCFTFPNGKRYVGGVFGKNNFYHRWASHKHHIKKGTKSALYCALRSFGWDNVKKEVLIVSSNDQYSKDLETSLIDVWKLNISRHGKDALGYNLTDGGDGCIGWNPSKEWREKMSKRHKGKKKVFSEEHKQHIREGSIGRVMSEDTKKKLSIKFAGEGNPFYGKKHSKKMIEKDRLAHCKYTYTIQNDNGDIVTSNNLCEFTRDYKVNRGTLMRGSVSKGWQLINKVDTTTHNNNKEENK